MGCDFISVCLAGMRNIWPNTEQYLFQTARLRINKFRYKVAQDRDQKKEIEGMKDLMGAMQFQLVMKQ